MGKLIDVDQLLEALEAEGEDLSDEGNYYNDDRLQGYSRGQLTRVIEGLPHEMSAVEYRAAAERMCFDEHVGKGNCSTCPLSSWINPAGINCGDYTRQHPEEAVAIVQKWATNYIQAKANCDAETEDVGYTRNMVEFDERLDEKRTIGGNLT